MGWSKRGVRAPFLGCDEQQSYDSLSPGRPEPLLVFLVWASGLLIQFLSDESMLILGQLPKQEREDVGILRQQLISSRANTMASVKLDPQQYRRAILAVGRL